MRLIEGSFQDNVCVSAKRRQRMIMSWAVGSDGMYAETVIVALLAICGILAAPPPKPLPAPFLAGVSFAMTNDLARGYDSDAARAALDMLKSRGVTAISVMPFAFQRTPAATALRGKPEHPASESDAQITAAVRAARARGLAVLVKPHVWVPHSWPGAI